MADYFHMGYVNSNNQWIIETHGELLITRLLRRIREGTLDPTDVSAFYIAPVLTKNGKSSGSDIIELRIDQNGQFIDPWPSGFFDEAYHENMINPNLEDTEVSV